MSSTVFVLALLGTFVAGFVAGVLWRESADLLLGKDDPVSFMQRTRKTASAVVDHRTAVATWAVVLVLSFDIVVAALVVLGRNDAHQIAAGARAATACQERYNRLSGYARDDRLQAAEQTALAEISNVHADLAYNRGLLHTLKDPQATLPKLLGVIQGRIKREERYLHTLVHYQHVKAAHGYPPPNLCSPHTRGLP